LTQRVIKSNTIINHPLVVKFNGVIITGILIKISYNGFYWEVVFGVGLVSAVVVFKGCSLHRLVGSLIKKKVHEVILDSFERMRVSKHHLDDKVVFIHVFKALMKSGGDDPVSMDPGSP
jgi:hypothetical protein